MILMGMTIDLNLVWYLLVGVLLTGYAILDGFDLGVGAVHLFARGDHDRRLMMNTIGPVWDGNEVWLVVGGGALFAAFPDVYATVFSGFYMAFMLLLVALIFRAVAIEFRGKQAMGWWRNLWDINFSLSSIVSSLLIGVALGNIIWGIPVGADKEFQGNFLTLLHPYSLMVGLMVLGAFTLHGALYVRLKTEGDLYKRAKEWAKFAFLFFSVLYLIVTFLTLVHVPHMSKIFRAHPALYIVPAFNILAIANIPRALSKNRDFEAFLSSAAAIGLLMALFGIGMFPDLVPSTLDPRFSLTIYNAASSQKTLLIMLTIALIGMPLVVAYTASIYWIFRGKVRIETTSY